MSAINETAAVTSFTPTECCPVDPCTTAPNPAPACEPNDNRSLPHLQQLLTECLSHQQKDEALILLRDYVNNNNGDWREYLMWDEKRYTRNLVLKNEIFEMIIICWNEGQQSPIHDHNGSDCFMAFLQGAAEETYYYIERLKEDPTECPDLRRGDSHQFSEGEVSYIADDLALHRIRPVKGRAVSLHVYSPPITTCSVYLQDLNRVTHPRSAYYSVNKQRVIDP
eukprot:TRINITY_DN1595_c0_g1_i1.p1 TRINITY_DN1595_c0_g1~~TRINITY_DN1595_c0_g1_i1.p1  ORF type:complete len:224 (+),score=44.64 TRINITY_DN1595_c0_g1_i1:53-724(+)